MTTITEAPACIGDASSDQASFYLHNSRWIGFHPGVPLGILVGRVLFLRCFDDSEDELEMDGEEAYNQLYHVDDDEGS